MALKRMGVTGRLVNHGMRSIDSIALNEHGLDHELVEVALAYLDKNEARSVYNRADYIERRRPRWHGGSNILSRRQLEVYLAQLSVK